MYLPTMPTGRIVVACYRPRPGCADALLALAPTHHRRLYDVGLVTRRAPVLMRARDGALIEVFEWKSLRAIEAAHHEPSVLAMWEEYGKVCDYVPVGTLAEASELFSGFDALPVVVERSPLSKVYNHVQVDARVGTSGAVSRENLESIAQAGYRHVINLLPDDNRAALEGEAELLAQLGVGYTHRPVVFAAPTPADLDAFEAAMAAHAGDKVWVHCAANFRVSCFVALHGRRQLGWSSERAQELLDEAWTPDDVWQAFLRAHMP